MENQKIENPKAENQKIENPAKEKKVKKEKASKTDAINFEKVKINLSKGDKSLLSKTSVFSKKSIYVGLEKLNSEEKKKFRGFIRRELRRFVNQILGKDRSESERIDSIKKFLSFYKKHWQIQDFKIENFSQSKDEIDLKDYKDLLTYVKRTLE